MGNGQRERRELERAVAVDCRACRSLCEAALELVADGARSRDAELVRALITCAAVAGATAGSVHEGLEAPLLDFCGETCERVAALLEERPPHPRLRECRDTCLACAESARALLWGED